MDPQAFDRLARALARPASRRGAVGVLLGGATLAARLAGLEGTTEVAAAKRRPAGKRAGNGENPAKVTLCHDGHTIQVAEPAVPAHLAQGDTVGPCGAPGGPPGGNGACLGLNQLCSIFGGAPCCHYGQPGKTNCTSGTGFLTACQALCRSDGDCQQLVHSPDVYCANDPVSDFGCANRHFDPTLHCCARKTCENPQDCQGGGTCCHFSGLLPAQCCLKDERCLATFGCVR